MTERLASPLASPRASMTLSLVIPVWNYPEGLRRLLLQAVDLGIFSQIIISDDGSDPPCSPDVLGLDGLGLDGPGLDIVYLRCDRQRGAGHARNFGLEHVTGTHVIFFDSDDLFTPEIRDLVPMIAAQAFDFCIFGHADSRVRTQGGYGPLASDERLWAAAGVAQRGAAGIGPAPAVLSAAGTRILCKIEAYPWNKIYRTDFLRLENIRCTEIPVHNDIELHWMSFLKAQRILATTMVCCEHFVHKAGSRLTNRTGRERLQVFAALHNLRDALAQSRHRLDFLDPFTEVCVRLFGWIGDRIEPDLRGEFHARARDFLLLHVSEPLYVLIALRNPGIAAQINRLLQERPA